MEVQRDDQDDADNVSSHLVGRIDFVSNEDQQM